ncbi:hypothetical protein BJ508DRAFT_417374, partial [Ascobolus immersus RN42]
MSLSTGFAGSIPAAVHAPLLVPRQQAQPNPDDLFYCTLSLDQPFYRGNDSEHLPGDQPVCADMLYQQLALKCIAVPTSQQLEAESYVPSGNGKEECEEFCQIAANGTMLEQTWQCWEEGCTDAREGKNEELNDKYLKEGVAATLNTICEPLGLWSNTTTDKDNVKDDDKKGEKEEEKDKKDDDSAASGFRIAGGAVALAVAVGLAGFVGL